MAQAAPQTLVVATREAMIEEAKEIVDAARARGIVLRLLGGLATRVYCRSLDFCERDHGDIDLIGHRRDAKRIEDLFAFLGYEENRQVLMATGGRQLQFVRECRHGGEWSSYRPHDEDHVDIFLDTFKMDHAIDLSARLELDDYAISPSDALLSKLQMARLEEKDERDVFTLLQDRADSIDVSYLARLCARDWGLFHDVRLNLTRLQGRLAEAGVDPEVESRVRAGMTELEEALEAEPKSLSWRLRSLAGTHLPWRNPVEEQGQHNADGG